MSEQKKYNKLENTLMAIGFIIAFIGLFFTIYYGVTSPNKVDGIVLEKHLTTVTHHTKGHRHCTDVKACHVIVKDQKGLHKDLFLYDYECEYTIIGDKIKIKNEYLYPDWFPILFWGSMASLITCTIIVAILYTNRIA